MIALVVSLGVETSSLEKSVLCIQIYLNRLSIFILFIFILKNPPKRKGALYAQLQTNIALIVCKWNGIQIEE